MVTPDVSHDATPGSAEDRAEPSTAGRCLYCSSVRRGVNLGNALDALPGSVQRLDVGLELLDVIRDAGFDTVRLPVAWSQHAETRAPFTIRPSLFAAVDRLIDGALARDLELVVDVHHYDELCADPTGHRNRFLALWSQIGERYAELPPSVRFELLNEPHGLLSGQRWNDLLAEGLAVVRDSNPLRDVVVGPAARNTIAGLAELDLPDDNRLIVTIHYYLPMTFTHQGAGWWPGARDWLGTPWGSPHEYDAVRNDLAAADAWARQRQQRLLVGEFGTIDLAPEDDRSAWTAHVRTIAEDLDIPWCYWDFATDFGIYDVTTRQWNQPMRTALLPT
jgi:endoglucanase